MNILCRLRDVVRRRRPEKCRNRFWFLLHDNAPAHLSVLDKYVLGTNSVTTLEHLHYSPDPASADF